MDVLSSLKFSEENNDINIESIINISQSKVLKFFLDNGFDSVLFNRFKTLTRPIKDPKVAHLVETLEKEYASYTEFKELLGGVFTSDKSRSQVYRCYWSPIIAKFSKESLCNNDVELGEFISWYQSFRKAYTSARNIAHVLRVLKSDLADSFHRENADRGG